MRRTSRIAVAITASALTLTACGGDEAVTPTETGAGGTTPSADATTDPEPAPEADFQVGMAYDLGGRNDQSFNQAAATGMDEAAEEFGFTTEEAEAQPGEAESAREERLRTLADNGFNPIVAVGFAYSASVGKVAAEYPDIQFAIVDDAIEGENITNLLFAEEQGSFLVGAAAALKTQSDHVGFIGGVQVELIQKFEAGFTAGAKAVNPDIVVDVTYLTQPPDFSGFGDPAKGRTAADGLYDGGADIVFAAAGGSGSGVFEGALAAGTLAIGVDSDQYNLVPPEQQPVIMTSMLKKVDVAVHDFLASYADGSVAAGPVVFDLESDGVGYSTSGGQVDDIAAQLDDFKAQIIAGDITVPTAPDDWSPMDDTTDGVTGRPPVVFIRGITQRCGTNYLRDLVATHPSLCHALHPVWEDFSLDDAAQLDAYVQQLSRRWPAEWGVPLAGVRADLMRGFGDTLVRSLIANPKRPGVTVVAKTPSVVGLQHFFELFPDDLLIVLVRDGRSVVESSSRSFGTAFGRGASEWAAGADTILEFRRQHAGSEGTRWLLLRYEDVVQDVAGTLSRVATAAEVDGAAYNVERAEALPVRGSSSFHTDDGAVTWDRVQKDESFQPLARWSEWTEDQHRQFNWVAGAQMAELGYTVQGPAPSVTDRLRYQPRAALRSAEDAARAARRRWVHR